MIKINQKTNLSPKVKLGARYGQNVIFTAVMANIYISDFFLYAGAPFTNMV